MTLNRSAAGHRRRAVRLPTGLATKMALTAVVLRVEQLASQGIVARGAFCAATLPPRARWSTIPCAHLGPAADTLNSESLISSNEIWRLPCVMR